VVPSFVVGEVAGAVAGAATPAGARVVDALQDGRAGTVVIAAVTDDASAAAAVLAAVRGSSLVLDASRLSAEAIDRLCDDLRRLGAVDRRDGQHGPPPSADPLIDDDGIAVLRRLAQGQRLGEAAASLHLSRRTADRRLAAVKDALGAASTVEAIVIAKERGLLA
jgi:DNA-binding NarL/FixJ family response regulator